MVNIARLLFKTTGIMTNKEIVRTSKKIGKTLADSYKYGDSVEVKKFNKFCKN